MTKEIVSTTVRTARVGFATFIGGLVAQLTGDPRWLALTPVISGLGKMLRMFFNLPKLPF